MNSNVLSQRTPDLCVGTKEAVQKLPDAIPGLDIATGLARVNGNSEVYVELIAAFGQQQGGAATDIRAALAANDLVKVAFLCHTLAGVAGNLSAKPLSIAAKALEDDVHSSKYESFDAALMQVDTAMSELMASIDALGLQEHRISHSIAEPVPDAPPQMGVELRRLAGMLDKREMAAVRLWRKIQTKIGPAGTCALTSRLDMQLRELEFSAASETLQALLNSLESSDS